MDLNMALPCRVSVYSEGGKTKIGLTVAGIPASPAWSPPVTALRKRSDSYLRSHTAWKTRFYWAPGYLLRPLVWRACYRYALFCCSPFGWLPKISSRGWRFAALLF
jgi:hypothetical protein